MRQLKRKNPLYLESASGEKYTNPFFLFSRVDIPCQKKPLWQKFFVTYYLFGARYYDADIGLWISPDPAREYHDLYSYIGNDPINGYDPNGMWRETVDKKGNVRITSVSAGGAYVNAMLKIIGGKIPWGGSHAVSIVQNEIENKSQVQEGLKKARGGAIGFGQKLVEKGDKFLGNVIGGIINFFDIKRDIQTFIDEGKTIDTPERADLINSKGGSYNERSPKEHAEFVDELNKLPGFD